MPPYTGTRDPIPAGAVALADLAFDVGTQTELDVAVALRQLSDADLTAIAALATTAFGRGLLDDADAGAARTTLAAAAQADLDAKAAKLTGLTQTYTTTSVTHANPVVSALTNSSGGTNDGTVEAMPSLQAIPAGMVTGERTAIANNFAELTIQANNLRTDLLNLKQFVNAVVDRLE